ncbi:MAG: bifunctional rhamnulose-1-phosphate aldolase/short-chain dehydrogenase [Acidobacteria bacterium]|nr:bifunctional rhamnulose-1-phosphate aldolase/short-chain dehydrogenase [Acidobacteriota bacterium]MBV9070427.1 bifunctional rhamnulose-1-phosphate aldolase/short-chain dehydrogenase [Acidobacteriota bacterium]MBV9187530.1 bifunctional rhamnulose-1-phosphate aldolase/short-chain dehydrogenase [Acidobacteriota bacterium]
MKNRWAETPDNEIDQLVYQSRLVGAEESLVLWGGGNNSVKAHSTDLLGAPIPVMYIKSSGSDMKTIVPKEFPAVRLDYIEPLRSRDGEMSDQEMVDYLARCVVDPSSRRPSIETLLHAFLPARAVLHTHADAILALTNTRGRETTVRECFGDSVITVPYLRPGFRLSRDVADAFASKPDAEGLVLMNHGLITWGDTAREAYEKHVELVSRAEEYLSRGSRESGVGATTPDTRHPTPELLAPAIRGALGAKRSVILEFDGSEDVLRFLARDDAKRITQIGPATPDHLLYTKRYPLFLEAGDDVSKALNDYVERYTAHYKNYPSEFAMLDPHPRVVLVPGAGMWTAGKDARAARIVRDIYRHTMRIIESAQGAGGYETLNDEDAFHAEYWPLELYKLTLLPKEKELAGKVAIVTGAASGIGRACAERFAEEGAHVVVTDVDIALAEEVAKSIVAKHGLRRAIALRLDVSGEDDVERAYAETIAAYGGVDIIVSNAGISSFGSLDVLPAADWDRAFAVNARGHFLVARAALRVMKQQKTGGSIVFNASKNVTAPGKEFGAYSVSKAAEAQLCRIVALEGGEFGIRANMLNPDAIFGGSRFWSDEMRSMRATAYGISSENLPDFYRNRTLLKTEVTADDVAEAALFLAGPRSSKTTGAMVPVDGGVKEAFPR